MGTYTVIEVSNAVHLTEEKLDRALDQAGLRDALDDLTVGSDEAGSWTIAGNSRWTVDEAQQLASDLTSGHPASLARVTEEWDTRDADEPGSSVHVYKGGQHRPDFDQETGLVPADLAEAIAAVRAALVSGGDLAPAAQWLVDGLEGVRQEADAEPEPVTVTKVTVTDEWGTDYSDQFAERYEFSSVIGQAGAELLVEDAWPGADRRIKTRDDVAPIIDRWAEASEEHTGRAYGIEWLDAADAYVIACWTGEAVTIDAVYDDGDGRGAIPFDSLVETLGLLVTVTWSDGSES